MLRAAYREYLVRRNGEPDVLRGTLPRREERLARIQPLEASGPDAEAFRAALARPFDRARSYPADALLFAALARLHPTFGFGSRDEYSRAVRGAVETGDDTEVFVAAERRYAARLFAANVAPFDGAPANPDEPLAVKLWAGRLGPAPWRRSLGLAAETVHAIALMNLLRVTRDALRFAAARRDRVEAQLFEVLTDAVGHLGYRRLGMEPRDLDRARRLVPAVALALGHRSPEMAALGASVFPSAVSIAHRLENGLPAEVRAAAFFS